MCEDVGELAGPVGVSAESIPVAPFQCSDVRDSGESDPMVRRGGGANSRVGALFGRLPYKTVTFELSLRTGTPVQDRSVIA